ncbi:MAG: polyribonucleotide nucleotidyltransferase, partial [Candidatus Eisenbacteria bacterium]|nr:polyribonucleotide nucleotidyltransferase [Candidatus Eisenbacteria bacterium]
MKLEPRWTGSTDVDGVKIEMETGRIARQANGSVLIRRGGTALLVTAVAANEPRAGTDFFPLTVEYRERFSAAGKFPGGYRKKEGRITDREILSCRLVDRTVRPLFPDGYYNEVQIQANVLAFDGDGDPEVLAIIGGAAALHFSDIPFRGPVVGLRVVKTKDGAIRALPNAKERESALLDMVISIGPDGLVMLEGLANEVPESDVVAAIDKASAAAKPLFTLLNEARSALGCEARPFDPPAPDATLVETVHAVAAAPLEEAYRIAAKQARQEAVDTISRDVQARFAESHPDQTSDVGTILHDLEKKILRSMALGEQRRVDGRGPTEIRPIFVEAGVLPSLHGSALFTRGETQALVVATLGTAKDEQDVETLGGSERERFQLHYSFPPYSVGEIRPLRGPGRREIGHGNLAFRGLAAVIPTASQFPYTIKVESEVTESNGSSSMATVCGGCLALMDAGIPVRRPVAGIAMGLISEGDRAVVLSDILGAEDHLGDMDFKVAGTTEGVTAVQLDNKLGWLPAELLERALAQAREGRLHILKEMSTALAEPRPELSPTAPRIQVMKIGTHRIRFLIGPAGKTIRDVEATTGATVEVTDDGTVKLFGPNREALRAAERRVQQLTGEPEVGKIYRGVVTGVKDFGCFVRLFEGIEGLVHISELDHGRVAETGQIASEGDEMI